MNWGLPLVAFLGLGAAAEAFLRAAAAAGTLRLEWELGQIVELEVAWGRDGLVRALEREPDARWDGARAMAAALERSAWPAWRRRVVNARDKAVAFARCVRRFVRRLRVA